MIAVALWIAAAVAACAVLFWGLAHVSASSRRAPCPKLRTIVTFVGGGRLAAPGENTDVPISERGEGVARAICDALSRHEGVRVEDVGSNDVGWVASLSVDGVEHHLTVNLFYTWLISEMEREIAADRWLAHIYRGWRECVTPESLHAVHRALRGIPEIDEIRWSYTEPSWGSPSDTPE